jgi:hypothetical protein
MTKPVLLQPITLPHTIANFCPKPVQSNIHYLKISFCKHTPKEDKQKDFQTALEWEGAHNIALIERHTTPLHTLNRLFLRYSLTPSLTLTLPRVHHCHTATEAQPGTLAAVPTDKNEVEGQVFRAQIPNQSF